MTGSRPRVGPGTGTGHPTRTALECRESPGTPVKPPCGVCVVCRAKCSAVGATRSAAVLTKSSRPQRPARWPSRVVGVRVCRRAVAGGRARVISAVSRGTDGFRDTVGVQSGYSRGTSDLARTVSREQAAALARTPGLANPSRGFALPRPLVRILGCAGAGARVGGRRAPKCACGGKGVTPWDCGLCTWFGCPNRP